MYFKVVITIFAVVDSGQRLFSGSVAKFNFEMQRKSVTSNAMTKMILLLASATALNISAIARPDTRKVPIIGTDY